MPNPSCLQCGCPLAVYHPQQYGRCNACFGKLAALPDVFAAEDKLLVRLHYFPGFAEDLTTWDTSILDDYTLKQRICWYPPVHGTDRPSELTTQVSASQLASISSTLSAIDLASLAVFKNWLCVDDAPFVHLFAPRNNIHVTVDQFAVSVPIYSPWLLRRSCLA